MESFILFYEKCRLCLNEPGVCNMFEKEDFPQDIYSCTGVRVHPSDNLPQKICTKCFKIVTSAKELRVLAAQNNSHLRSLLSNVHDDDDEPRLQIDEGISSSETQSSYFKDKEQSTPSKQNKDCPKSSSKKQLAVRKDLFDNSTSVTSSTKNSDTNKPSKRIKLEKLEPILHECSHCSKKFDTNKKLYLHLRLHNKTVVCPLDACEKRFASKGDLEKHFRTHTGEKPYTCNVCERGFSQRCSLKSHKDSVHGGR